MRRLLERAGDSRRAGLRAVPAPVRRRRGGRGRDLRAVPRRAAAPRRHRRRHALQRRLAQAGAGVQARPADRARADAGAADRGALARARRRAGWSSRCRCIRWRLWRRGFNQSALLAREIARLRGATLLVDGLVRRKPTPTLGGLGRGARARALSGAIAVNPRRQAAAARARKVVLVDDVMTSGATSDACVGALKRAGAEQVVVACFARVLDEAL